MTGRWERWPSGAPSAPRTARRLRHGAQRLRFEVSRFLIAELLPRRVTA